ncbi:TetR/AcrR family transcriptional regulator [Lysobacter antibioticus]|uniref:TetR/AcrR family transcriptional regulator n=1 Tax=Lysobacter antibioticus TaxID=84531 RepID=UPI0003460EB6|nr:TetR/AcrR family transcriptional regulator [Lysobacter antibioticus]
MASSHLREGIGTRRSRILRTALECFLNFGYQKSSIDDIARRSGIARTLVYRIFRNKEDVFAAVFEQWIASRHPAARAVAASGASAGERLSAVMELLVIAPWRDMAGAPMAGQYYEVCRRLIPEHLDNHRHVLRRCTQTVLGDELAADVFLLSLDGLFANAPTADAVQARVKLLIDRFTAPPALRFGSPGAMPERFPDRRGTTPIPPGGPRSQGLPRPLHRP